MTKTNNELAARASEVVADIAFIAGFRFAKQEIQVEDSRSLMQDITEWACDFERVFNRDAHGDNYMTLVDDYANLRLEGNHDKAQDFLKRMALLGSVMETEADALTANSEEAQLRKILGDLLERAEALIEGEDPNADDIWEVIEAAREILAEDVAPGIEKRFGADDGTEVLPGATRQEIAEVMMQDIVGDYNVPDEVPEWAWVERVASFNHAKNGESGVWEFILYLGNHWDDIPERLAPTIKAAREKGIVYLIFHQGT